MNITGEINIDTHDFKIKLESIEEVKEMLNHIENNIGEGIFNIHTNEHIVDRNLELPEMYFNPNKLPKDTYMTPLMIEMYLTSSYFNVLYNTTHAFRYRVRREHDEYYIIFSFVGLTQYTYTMFITHLSLYRRSKRNMILEYIDDRNIHIEHLQLDICIDIDDKFFRYDIIGNNGMYREWSYLEKSERNRYSKDRKIEEGRFIKDRAIYTNQMIMNVYDKGYKNDLDGGMVRIEYKLLRKGIDKITNDNFIDIEMLYGLLTRYRVLRFDTVRSREVTLGKYNRDTRYDRDGNEYSDATRYKKRKKLLPRLENRYIDTLWLRDVESIVIDNLI